MVKFEPRHFEESDDPLIRDVSGNLWAPILEHPCSFDPSQFVNVMTNFMHNPNYNSNWLFRADILSNRGSARMGPPVPGVPPRTTSFEGFELEDALVRKLIPRNPNRDRPLEQTCLFLRSEDGEGGRVRSLVVYIPHLTSPEEVPFYHPSVRGIAHLHEWDPSSASPGGKVSIHLWPFAREDLRANNRMQRTALMLLQLLHKHGEGRVAGYVKRVTHDTLIPQKRFQDRHTALKSRYAKDLLDSWAEATDPKKHVFEDIAIAAFLIELWADMYKEGDGKFPGFVDIGCGNGLLVYLLRKEGYAGWGFDARARKSWSQYNIQDAAPDDTSPLRDSLQARVLLPSFVARPAPGEGDDDVSGEQGLVHDGVFPKGTFIISNHADELTPWTPILAAQSQSPFIIIPCCSHDLSGARFRAPAPKDTSKGTSAYASLVSWVEKLARECHYEVETEMLRIPSTRNTALVGRKPTGVADLEGIISKYGGTAGYYENVSKLLKTGPRGH
ncbi:related to tRNA (uracil-O(2)-)-methyltransferase [Cephalotrichum gorgonifer]|uniref:tRNA (uracil-O(2)-)-methyltransferase n=1 Tax=Cephalotrichum gorgonifer TaxID=2041049 RepID=A0AAE8SSR7_9PEZI|nr:related to tRNA (uracil-O(2)-)-methyltransferase [Cephalotrichum gorgonifer]